MPDNKQYYVQLPAEGDALAEEKIVDAQSFDKHKEQLFNTYKNAKVKELSPIKMGEKFDYLPDDEFEVSLDDGEKKVVSAGQFVKNLDKLYQNYPTAQVTRRRNVNYWGDKLGEIENRIGALEKERESLPVTQEEVITGMNMEDADIMVDDIVSASHGKSNASRKAEIDNELDQLYRMREGNYAYQQFWAGQAKQTEDAIKDIDARREKLAKKIASGEKLNTMLGQGVNAGYQPRVQRDEDLLQQQATLTAAKHLFEDAHKTALAPSRYGGDDYGAWHDFWQGMKDGALDAITVVSLGKVMDEASTLVPLLKRAQDVIGKNNSIIDFVNDELDGLANFTPEEKILLHAFVKKAEIEGGRGETLSRSYQAGQSAIQSAGFMADFALAGGIGNAAAKAVVGNAAKAAGKNALKKVGAETLYGLIKAGAMTPFMPSFYANATNNILQFNDAGGVDLSGKAMLRAGVDGIIENVSETIGGKPLEFLAIPAEKIKFFAWGKAMRNSPWMQSLKQAGWNGLFEEYVEEWTGNALRVMTGVDKDALKNFATVDQQLVTLGAFAPMTLLGGGVTIPRMIGGSKALAQRSKELQAILGEKMDKATVDAALNVGDIQSPEDLGKHMGEVYKQAVEAGVDPAAAYRGVVEFTDAAAKYNVLKGMFEEQKDIDRSRELLKTNKEVGNDNWYHGGENGANFVRTITDAEGNERFVVGDAENTLALVDRAGNKTTLSYKKLEEGVNAGVLTDSGERYLNDYLDDQTSADHKRRETERMATEAQQNAQELYSRAQIGTEVNIGSPEKVNNGIIRGIQGGMFIVEAADGVHKLTEEEMMSKLGMQTRPMTDAEMEEKEADEVVRHQDLKRKANEAKGINIAPALGLEGEAILGHVHNPQKSSDGTTMFQVDYNLNGTDEIAFITEDQLTQIVSLAEQKPVAEVESEEQAQQPASTVPTDFRGNPLPMRTDSTTGELEVDENGLWDNDPEAWAHWNDANPEQVVSSQEKLEYSIGTLNAQIEENTAALRQAVLDNAPAEQKDQIKANLSRIKQRLGQLAEILGKYTAPTPAAEQLAPATEQVGEQVVNKSEQVGEAQPAPAETPARPAIGVISKEILRDIQNRKGRSDGDLREAANSLPDKWHENLTIALKSTNAEEQAAALAELIEISRKNAGNAAADAVLFGVTQFEAPEINPVQQAIEAAREEVDTNPTEAQKEAGNYKKGHITLDGYNITLENPKGSTRSGVDAGGKEWSQVMNNDYGYIRMTEGVDGDHIDVFLSDHPEQGNVFVVDQVNPSTGEFDEHKVMYGFGSAEEAAAAYLSNYEEGWQGLGTITEVSKDEFKKWVDSSTRKTKPFAEYKSVNAISGQNAGTSATSETESGSSEKPNTQSAETPAEAVQDLDAVLADKGRTAILKRIDKWKKLLGDVFVVHDDISTVTNEQALARIQEEDAQVAAGEPRDVHAVRGWYEPETGKAHIYLPHLLEMTDRKGNLDETILHEVVSHKGLRALQGKHFDEFMDIVWGKLMTPAQQQYYLDYVNGTADSQRSRRAAADEFLAHAAEKNQAIVKEVDATFWTRLADAFKDFINTIFGEQVFKEADTDWFSQMLQAAAEAVREESEAVQGEESETRMSVLSNIESELDEDGISIDEGVRFSVVTDEAKIAELENGEKRVGYRNVALNEDGSLSSPMAAMLGKKGEKSVPTASFHLGDWLQAEENPDMATDDGKINLIKPKGKGRVDGVDYNPYEHIRPTLVNKQFTQAWDRPELVYTENEYPASELTSGYKAPKAKKSVGEHNWNGGKLILSRWDKPVRIVPWEEVADAWEEEFGDTGVTFDIVPPGLLPVLDGRGVKILAPKASAGKEALKAYNDWKAGQKDEDGLVHRLNDEGFSVDEKNDDVRFSVRYAPDEKEAKQVARNIAAETGRSLNTAKRWVKSETSLAAIILDEINAPYLDYEADDRFAAIKKDSDYPQGTVDFNNICRKRTEFTNLYQRIQKAYPDVIITGEDLATIRDMMKKRGITVACGLCYVEDRRQLLGEIAKGFIENLKGNFENYAKGSSTKQKNAEKFRELLGDDKKDDLNIYDLITLEGSTQLSQEHPGIYAAFNAFNSARGQQAGNLFQGYAEYKREILKWSPAKVKSVNDNGGLRVFSYSDFEAHHLIDLVQTIQDCATKGVMVQGYTKVPAFARAVANTNIKLNRSLIPLGDTGIVDGKLAYDPVEGIDINDKDFLESNDNVGNILIGINDEQIRLAMADPFVHYIIPYHSNQSGVLRQMKQTGAWTNYRNEQTDKGPDVGNHGVNIYTDVLAAAEAEGKPIRNEKQFVEKFLSVCKERGWIPRFERFLNKNKKGDYVYTPGYYKLLLDFKLFDEQGRILPQKPVVAEFDDEFNAKILNDYVAGEKTKNTRELDRAYKDIVKALNLDERENDVRFSAVTKEQDKEYMDAVEAGNMPTVERLVYEAAQKAGYTINAYHGGPYRFNVFDKSKLGVSTKAPSAKEGFFFTDWKGQAGGFAVASTKRADSDALLADIKRQVDEMDDESVDDVLEYMLKSETFVDYIRPSYKDYVSDCEEKGIQPTKEGYLQEYARQNFKEGQDISKRQFIYDAIEENYNGDYWDDVYEFADEMADLGIRVGHIFDVFLKMENPYIDEIERDYTTGGDVGEDIDVRMTDVLKKAKAEGHDGVIFKYVKEDNRYGFTPQYVVFEPNQIKSAEPIVRDDKGEVIPLSERFNPQKDDIRFSIKTYHGSGADFDRFDHTHMGEGEGGQAYGYGTYVSTNRDTGLQYARTIGGAEDGRLYTVEIPDDNGQNYIHWDKPITREQSAKLIAAIKEQMKKDGEWYEGVDYELESGLGYGTYGSRVEGGIDYFLGDMKNYATGEDPGAKRDAELLRSIGIVGFEIPVDRNGGQRFAGSNYVIFDENDLNIVDKTKLAERIASADTKQKVTDGKGEALDQADIDEVRFSLSRNNKAIVAKWLEKRSDLTKEERGSVLNYIDGLDDAKLQLAAARWFAGGTIRLPEDMEKVQQAVSIAEKAKVDPLQYSSPMELLNAHADFKASEKRINPDDVPTLHKAQEIPENGIVIYDVDESDESRENMRQIINTHFGKDASPWCLLQGDGEGNLTERSKGYWKHYSAYPKQVAFKDGKLLAFSANDSKERVWWDRQDEPHSGIPVTMKMPGDELGRTATYELSGDGTFGNPTNIHRGNMKNGPYEVWKINEDGKEVLTDRQHYKDGKFDGSFERWYLNGQPFIVATYREGNSVGDYLRYYNDGSLNMRYHFDDRGLRDGEQLIYDDNGKLKNRSNYAHGLTEGLQESWDVYGNLRRREEYHDGRRNGLSEEFYANGQRRQATNYKNGRMNGLSETWYENGQLQSRVHSVDGIQVGKYEGWHENGERDYVYNYDEHGDEHGACDEYNHNGQLVHRTFYNHGVKEGVEQGWLQDGKVQYQIMWKDGMKNGFYQFFYPNGQVRDRITYKDDLQNGVSEWFRPDGSLIHRMLMKDGSAERDLGNEPQTSIYTDTGEIAAEQAEKYGIRFSVTNMNQQVFVSNAQAAVENIKNDKATPEQWLNQLTKNGGLKAAEDKWLGLSDWLKAQDKKTITKQEILDFIEQNRIQIEEEHYADLENSGLLDGFQQEYDTIPFDDNEALWEDADNRLAEFYSDMEEKYGEDYLDEMNESERITEERLLDEREKYAGEQDLYQAAFDAMVEKYGDDFSIAFGQINGKLYVNDDDAAAHFLGVRQINRTREDYTTDGLDNKREIALTVPTIEPYNENDEVHFGDAGEGRAVAWSRFGDAYTEKKDGNAPVKVEYVGKDPVDEATKKAIDGVLLNWNDTESVMRNERRENQFWAAKSMFENAIRDNMYSYDDERKAEAEKVLEALDNLREEDFEARYTGGKKVLFIDEIQSKRHQDAREEGGYKRTLTAEETDRLEEARAIANHRHSMSREIASQVDAALAPYDTKLKSGELTLATLKEKNEDIRSLIEMRDKEFEDTNRADRDLENIEKELRPNGVPAAPFEKNWHELTMKRMLRLAAEEGYDYVAWTTGDQQAERYNIGNYVSSLNCNDIDENGRTFGLYLGESDESTELEVDNNGIVVRGEGHLSQAEGHPLYDLVGKELAVKMMQMEIDDVLEDIDLNIGNNGMRGFYDGILVNFINKYGKKWGVKVEDLEIPGIGTEHAVPVTEEMRESVMEGQPMFSVRNREARDEEGPVNLGQKWNETDKEYYDRLVADYTRKYREVVPMVVLEPGLDKDEVGSLLGVTGDDLDKLYNIYEESFANGSDKAAAGIYLPDAKKIAIFALPGSSPLDIENTLFHENIHAAIDKLFKNHDIPEWSELLDKNAEESPELKKYIKELRQEIRQEYDLSKVEEEEVAHMLSQMMVSRRPKALEIIGKMSPKARQAVKPLLDETGYSYEQEIRSRVGDVHGVPEGDAAFGSMPDANLSGEEGEDFGPAAEGSLFGDTAARYALSEKRRVASHVADLLGVEVEFKPAAEMTTANGKRLAGRWQDGRISICPENCRSTDDAVRTVIHEAVGHNGLRKLVGAQDMRTFALTLYRQLPRAARQEITDAAFNKYGGNIVEAVEEWLAERSEDMSFGKYPFEDEAQVGELTAWDRVKDAVRRLFARFGIGPRLTDNDIRWILWQSYYANKEEDLPLMARRFTLAHRLGFSASQQDDRSVAQSVTRNKVAEEVSAARLYNMAVQSAKARLHEVFVDKDDAVNRLVEAIEKSSGKPAQDFEDVRLALNQQSSKGLAATEKFIREKYNPMMEAIKAIVKQGDLSVEDIERYVKIKHGIERNEVFAKRDARNYYRTLADKEIKRIKESNAEPDIKDSLISREKSKLDKHLESIDKGTDGKYKEFRKKDYGGLTSMYSEYDNIAPYQEGVESYEEYQARALKARHPMYETLEETEEAAEKEVRSFEESVGSNLTDELWKRINAATKATLQEQYKSNMMSKRQYEIVRDMFKFYVPLRGFKDNVASDMYNYYMSDNSGEFTPPLLKAGGRKSESESPFGYIGSMASSAITEGVKNQSKLALYYFITNRPENDLMSASEVWYENTGMTEDGKRIFTPVYPPLTEDLSSESARKAYADWEKAMETKAKQGFAYKSAKDIDLNDSVIHIDDRQKDEHIIKFKVNGDDKMMFINGNPRAAQAINNMLNVNAAPSELVNALQKVLRYVAMMNTQLNPEFWMTNMQRDLLFATMSESIKGDKAFNDAFRRNLVEARKVIKMRNAYNNGTLGDTPMEKLYREFVENGGVTGYSRVIGTEEWEREIRKFNKDDRKVIAAAKDVFEAVGGFGEAIEQLTRFAAYKTSREAGKGVIESVADAKELTVNFNRKGSGIAVTFDEAAKLRGADGKPLSKLEQALVVAASSLGAYGRAAIVFFNAAVQGLNNMVQLAKKQPKTMAIWTAGYFVLGVLNAALHAMLDDPDDDDYLDMPADERGNNLVLGGKGVYLKWALPQEMRVFYRLGDVLVNHALGRTPNKSVLGEMLHSVGEVSPIDFSSGISALAPSVASPIVEIIKNEDWQGGRVYNDRKFMTKGEVKHHPKYTDPLKNTPKAYVAISKALNAISGGNSYEAGKINVDPNILEHLFEGYTGGAGTSVEKLMVFLGNAAKGKFVVRNTPFLRRLLSISDERYRNAHVTELYYYYKDEAESTKRIYKKALKAGDEKMLEKLQRNGDLAVMQIYESFRKPMKTLDDDLKATLEKDTEQRKAIMRQQDAMRKEMIKQISELK